VAAFVNDVVSPAEIADVDAADDVGAEKISIDSLVDAVSSSIFVVAAVAAGSSYHLEIVVSIWY
jgi:hypothetical protein